MDSMLLKAPTILSGDSFFFILEIPCKVPGIIIDNLMCTFCSRLRMDRSRCVHVEYQDVLIEQSPQVRLDQGFFREKFMINDKINLNNVLCMPPSIFENLNLSHSRK